MSIQKKIFISAGEPSGDLHASNLVKNLKRRDPSLKFFGLGGELSKASGVDIIFNISKLAIIGLTEVLKNIFTVGKAYTTLLKRIDSEKPDVAILVDYPGFNLRLAKALKKRSIPVIYYISPQVWAWGASRIEVIKKYVDKMIVFFKFEEELYKKHGINAEFVGHPLLDTVKVTSSKEEFFKRHGLAEGKVTIAILPGSRKTELRYLLKSMAGAAGILSKKIPDAQFVIARFKGLDLKLYNDFIKQGQSQLTRNRHGGTVPVSIKIVEDDIHNLLSSSDLAIIASGTATLEATIIGSPFIIVYKINLISYIASQIVRKIPFIGLANIIAGKELVPELLQYDVTPEKIASKALEILNDSAGMSRTKEALSAVKSSLGKPGASERAADAVIRFIQ